jgi:ketosteroid isomerase-like protein
MRLVPVPQRRWIRCVVLLALAAAVCLPAAAQSKDDPRSDREIDAIRKVIERSMAVTNDPETYNLPLDQRVELGRRIHRPDSTYEKGELPLYFGALNAPVARGAEEYIRKSEESAEWYRARKYRFSIQVDEMQIRYDGDLAVVVATPTGVITAPDGRVVGGAPGRWTVVLQRSSDGDWYIIHEHLSVYDPKITEKTPSVYLDAGAAASGR